MEWAFQIDLSFLFEVPSIWRTLVQTLIVVVPLAIAISGYAAWRVGDRQGLLLLFWAALYAVWMLWPVPMPLEFVLPGRVVSVVAWFWLVGAWGRRVQWHDPMLLFSNGFVVALLLTLFITAFVAGLRDIMGWDIPAQDASLFPSSEQFPPNT